MFNYQAGRGQLRDYIDDIRASLNYIWTYKEEIEDLWDDSDLHDEVTLALHMAGMSIQHKVKAILDRDELERHGGQLEIGDAEKIEEQRRREAVV